MIQVKDRVLCVPDEERSIGYVADNQTEVRQFLITDAAFFDFTFQLDLANGIYTDVVTLEKEKTESGVLLTWKITATNLQCPGGLRAQLRAFSEEGEVWHSQVVSFLVSESIYAPDAFPPIPPSEYEVFRNSLQTLLKKTETIENGEGEDALLLAGAEGALADSCVAIGPGSMAGCKGYYIKSIDLAAKKIYLSAEKTDMPEMAKTNYLDTGFKTPDYAPGDYISVINGAHYCYCATISEIQNNVITYSGDLGFSSFEEDANLDGHILYIPSKPEVGVVTLGNAAFVAGEGNKGNGRGVFIGGVGGEGAAYATVGGKNNRAGYGTGVFGSDNFVPGLASFGGGESNKVLAPHTGFCGEENTIEKTAEFSDISGRGNTVKTAYTSGGGLNNETRNGRGNTFHGEDLDIEGSFNDVEGRGSTVRGDFNFVRGDHLKACGNQMVFGLYNKEESDKLLIVGSGTQAEPKNIFTVDRNGKINAEALASTPENRRMIFGGRNLGSTVTDEQIEAIRSGTFEGLLLGDYWYIDGYHFRIADFDYYYGVQGLNKHHVVIVPDEVWGKNSGVVGDMSIVTSGKGGYARTKMFQKVLPDVYDKFITDSKLQPIGKYILEYQDLLTNAVTDNVPVGSAWYPCNVNIMDEMMLFGTKINAPMRDGNSAISTQTASRFQFALFAVAPKFITCLHNYWLRDVASFTYFSFMAANGAPMTRKHDYASGRIRPYFLIG